MTFLISLIPLNFLQGKPKLLQLGIPSFLPEDFQLVGLSSFPSADQAIFQYPYHSRAL
jgi:hypothetical protein